MRADVALWALPVGAAPTRLVKYRDVHDVLKTYAVENGDGTTDLWFERQWCDRFDFDGLKTTWGTAP